MMAQSNAERYNATIRIRIRFQMIEGLPPNPSAPVCELGHLPLHKGGMRRCRASAININLSVC